MDQYADDMSALLADQAREFEAQTGSGRLTYLAARFAARLGGPMAEAAVADDQQWLTEFEGISRGGHVSPETGARAAALVAPYLAEAAPATLTTSWSRSGVIDPAMLRAGWTS